MATVLFDQNTMNTMTTTTISSPSLVLVDNLYTNVTPSMPGAILASDDQGKIIMEPINGSTSVILTMTTDGIYNPQSFQEGVVYGINKDYKLRPCTWNSGNIMSFVLSSGTTSTITSGSTSWTVLDTTFSFNEPLPGILSGEYVRDTVYFVIITISICPLTAIGEIDSTQVELYDSMGNTKAPITYISRKPLNTKGISLTMATTNATVNTFLYEFGTFGYTTRFNEIMTVSNPGTSWIITPSGGQYYDENTSSWKDIDWSTAVPIILSGCITYVPVSSYVA